MANQGEENDGPAMTSGQEARPVIRRPRPDREAFIAFGPDRPPTSIFPTDQLEAPADWAPTWMPLRERALFVTLLAAGVSALIVVALSVFVATLSGTGLDRTAVIAAMGIGTACAIVGWVGLGRNV